MVTVFQIQHVRILKGTLVSSGAQRNVLIVGHMENARKVAQEEKVGAAKKERLFNLWTAMVTVFQIQHVQIVMGNLVSSRVQRNALMIGHMENAKKAAIEEKVGAAMKGVNSNSWTVMVTVFQIQHVPIITGNLVSSGVQRYALMIGHMENARKVASEKKDFAYMKGLPSK